MAVPRVQRRQTLFLLGPCGSMRQRFQSAAVIGVIATAAADVPQRQRLPLIVSDRRLDANLEPAPASM